LILHKRFKMNKRAAAGALFALAAAFVISGCGAASPAAGSGSGSDGHRRVVLTSGFADDDLFTESSDTKTLHASALEVRVFIDDLAGEYRSILGDDVYSGEDGDEVKSCIREEALSRLSRVKTLNLYAADKNIALTDDETSAADSLAEQYIAGLTEAQKSYLLGDGGEGKDSESGKNNSGSSDTFDSDIRFSFEQYALSDKVYEQTISSVNTEISDDEARILTADSILFSTTNSDGSAMTEDEKKAVYAKAQECMNRIKTGDGTTFDALISEYSDSDVNHFKICRNGTEKDSYLVNGEVSDGDTTPLAETAYNLAENEKSDIIETSAGYRIVKCISTFDRAETEANKAAIVAERQAETFDEAIASFEKNLETDMNDELWETISLPDYTDAGEGFFTVYNAGGLQFEIK